MTIEKILNMSADELDALTDQQKMEYFSKYFPVTRPEQQTAPIESRGKRIVEHSVSLSKKSQANDILAQFGFKLKL